MCSTLRRIFGKGMRPLAPLLFNVLFVVGLLLAAEKGLLTGDAGYDRGTTFSPENNYD